MAADQVHQFTEQKKMESVLCGKCKNHRILYCTTGPPDQASLCPCGASDCRYDCIESQQGHPTFVRSEAMDKELVDLLLTRKLEVFDGPPFMLTPECDKKQDHTRPYGASDCCIESQSGAMDKELVDQLIRKLGVFDEAPFMLTPECDEKQHRTHSSNTKLREYQPPFGEPMKIDWLQYNTYIQKTMSDHARREAQAHSAPSTV